MPSRRIVLKYIALGTVGYAFLPACNDAVSSLSEEARKLGLSAADEATLVAICQALLPVKPVPKDQEQPELHRFVLKMMNDCYPPEVQQQFKEGLTLFGGKAGKETGTSSGKAGENKMQKVFAELEMGTNKEDSLWVFYRLTKSLTIRAYTGSKYYLTQIRPYVQIPGKYQGCV